MNNNIEDILIDLLEGFGVPVIRQGSLAENEPYPQKFFTFWNNQSYDGTHYDNSAKNIVYDFDVNVYSDDPAQTYALLRSAKGLLKQNGFIVSGDGYDVASDVETHTGRGMNALYVKY